MFFLHKRTELRPLSHSPKATDRSRTALALVLMMPMPELHSLFQNRTERFLNFTFLHCPRKKIKRQFPFLRCHHFAIFEWEEQENLNRGSEPEKGHIGFSQKDTIQPMAASPKAMCPKVFTFLFHSGSQTLEIYGCHTFGKELRTAKPM